MKTIERDAELAGISGGDAIVYPSDPYVLPSPLAIGNFKSLGTFLFCPPGGCGCTTN